jgi:integrase
VARAALGPANDLAAVGVGPPLISMCQRRARLRSPYEGAGACVQPPDVRRSAELAGIKRAGASEKIAGGFPVEVLAWRQGGDKVPNGHEITTVDIAAVLRPVWRTKPEVARKLYPAIRRVFERARILLRDEHGISMADNPARWTDLKAMGFETPAQLSRGHHTSLPFNQMVEFMADLRTRDAIAARALEFLILTNVRTDAVLKATWDQLDLDQAVWTVPLVNLKDRKHRTEGFRVPLVERAVAIVQQMRQGQVSGYVFPGHAQGKPFSNMALLPLLQRMNAGEKKWLDPASSRPITVHGFRATFRTWAEEAATFPHAVVEQAMGHQVGTQVERAYRRTDVLDKRRALMETWAQWCEPNADRRDYVELFGNRTAAAS